MSASAIRCNNLSKSYPMYGTPVQRLRDLFRFAGNKPSREFTALTDVSFEVERGTIFGIVGENGAGKSTLLQVIAGILRPTSGTIETSGRVSALLELGTGFNPEFNGRDNVYLNASILGLKRPEIDARYPEILEFAEIGEFIGRPVKTYSSGMIMRLAFAVAIHVSPEILLVDESLAVGDIYFRQRCMRKINEMKKAGVTILYVTHSIADVKTLAQKAMWLAGGKIEEIGDPDFVIQRYQAHMANKDVAYLKHHYEEPAPAPLGEAAAAESGEAAPVAVEPVTSIPNVDYRYGTGRAKILGIAAYNASGEPLVLLPPGEEVTLRISVRAEREMDRPMVGFMLRNHLGVDFSGSNTALEKADFPPMRAGQVATVDFRIGLPMLYPGHFSFSPAVATGTLDAYEMCDWIDNALTLQMEKRVEMYGYFRMSCAVRIHTAPPAAA